MLAGVLYCEIKILIAALLRIQPFQDITPCRLVLGTNCHIVRLYFLFSSNKYWDCLSCEHRMNCRLKLPCIAVQSSSYIVLKFYNLLKSLRYADAGSRFLIRYRKSNTRLLNLMAA